MFRTLLERTADRRTVTHLLDESPVLAILGARQVGKTTLASEVANRAVPLQGALELIAPLRTKRA